MKMMTACVVVVEFGFTSFSATHILRCVCQYLCLYVSDLQQCRLMPGFKVLSHQNTTLKFPGTLYRHQMIQLVFKPSRLAVAASLYGWSLIVSFGILKFVSEWTVWKRQKSGSKQIVLYYNIYKQIFGCILNKE